MRLWRLRPTPCNLPEGTRLYVCGDIHGRLDLLDALLDRIEADFSVNPIDQPTPVFLGDYVDRGPNAAHVLERLIEISTTYRAICLKGNHEAMLLRFLSDPLFLSTWAEFGGIPTLQSYGLKPSFRPSTEECGHLAADLVAIMPVSHLEFLQALPTSYSCGSYFFAHAGIRPGLDLQKQADEDLMWIREDFLECEDRYEKTVVHGHSPVIAPDMKPNRINIDTGAYATGLLTCLVLEGAERRFI